MLNTWPSKRGRPSSATPKDRFIPNRSAMDLEVSHYELTRKYHHIESTDVNRSPAKEEYKRMMQEVMQVARPRVLNFGSQVAQAATDHENAMRSNYTHNRLSSIGTRKYIRHIPQDSERILDAPMLANDFYLNVLDWSKTGLLAVGLADSVYSWKDGAITMLAKAQHGEQITSLAFTECGSHIAVGTSEAEVQIWDVRTRQQLRTMPGHTGRVGALSWSGPLVSSGSRDANILHHDCRIAAHRVGTLQGHHQEVCGLKWSPAGSLLASGGNDNTLNIWDDRYQRLKRGCAEASLHRITAHKAAVKALAWCPWHKSLLASGGGTADGMIRFWNSSTGTCLNAVDTRAQVWERRWARPSDRLMPARPCHPHA
uniref:CDC20/Fizzy WD40 domain-containing protein n=1 Tax=Haptolina ericina TaxID=156174 RepID=A0A7S3AYK9_9EUKA